MKQAIDTLRKNIKSSTLQSRAIRKRIHEASGKDRWDLWENKRHLGSGSRIQLLAYAMIRGRGYELVEATCAVVPSATAIHREIMSVLAPDSPERERYTVDQVRAWLKRPVAATSQQEAA